MNAAIIFIVSTVAGLAVVGLIIYVVYQKEKERTARLEEVATEMGLQFHPKGDPATQDAIGHLRLFKQGHARKMRNLFRGQSDDVDLALFGYSYNTGGGQHQQVHQQTVISFQSPQLSLPAFELRPEGFFHKIGQSLGYHDIDFDSHPEFSKRYLLRGPDEESIRKLFTPELLSFFEKQTGVSIEAAGDRLVYFRAGKRVSPQDVRSFMEEGFQFYTMLKEPERT